jgi:flagellar biosynthesis/type III secretory pathway protein FliH
MNRLVRRIVPERKGDGAPEPPEQALDDALGYSQVEDRVTAAVELTKRVAEDTLETARREAERLLTEVEGVAKATIAQAARKVQAARHETEQLHAEAKRYDAETRKAADDYAAEKRSAAEEAAAKAVAEAEELVRRKAAMAAEAGRFEERLQNLVTVFRGMTEQLEELLAKGPEPTERDTPSAETLQESLEAPIKGRRAQSK